MCVCVCACVFWFCCLRARVCLCRPALLLVFTHVPVCLQSFSDEEREMLLINNSVNASEDRQYEPRAFLLPPTSPLVQSIHTRTCVSFPHIHCCGSCLFNLTHHLTISPSHHLTIFLPFFSLFSSCLSRFPPGAGGRFHLLFKAFSIKSNLKELLSSSSARTRPGSQIGQSSAWPGRYARTATAS